MTDPLLDQLWEAIDWAARQRELHRRVRLRRMQERQAAARDYTLVYEPKTPLTRAWARHDLQCEDLPVTYL